MSPSDSRKITSQPGNVFSLSQLAERHKTKTPAASSSYLHSHSSLLSAQASHSASPPTVPSASSPRTVSLAHLAAQHKVGSNSPSREGSSLLALAAQHAARPSHAPALSLSQLASAHKSESVASSVPGTASLSQLSERQQEARVVKPPPGFNLLGGSFSNRNKPQASERLSLSELAKSHKPDVTEAAQPSSNIPTHRPPPGFEQPSTSLSSRSLKPPPGLGFRLTVSLSELAAKHSTPASAAGKDGHGRSGGRTEKLFATSVSSFAVALCSSLTKKSKRNTDLNHSSFSVLTQCSDGWLRAHRSRAEVAVASHVVAFDFSTPSPDDFVKERQKDAFVRREFASVSLVPGIPPSQTDAFHD